MKKTIYLAMFLTALSSEAHAYIDPGFGSMLIQGILAVIAAIGAGYYSFKDIVKKVISKFKKKS